MLNHRIKYYYKIGDRANVMKYQNECKLFQTKCMQLPSGVAETFFNDSSLTRLLRSQSGKSPDTNSIVNNDSGGLIISDVRTEELPQEPDSTGDEIDELDSEVSGLNARYADEVSPFDLLEPMFQTSESALDTESGGNIHTQNEAINARRKHNENLTYQCQHCNKIYRKAHVWRKHLRSHQIIDQRKTNAATAAAAGEKRKHKCPDCSQDFDTLNVLKKHSIVHEKCYSCNICGDTFRLVHDFSWHMISCEAKTSATTETTHSARRRTRSQGRPLSMVIPLRQGFDDDDDDCMDSVSRAPSRCSVDSTQTDSLYNEKIEVVKLWAAQLDIGEKPDPKDLANNNLQDDDCLSVISGVSGMTRISEVSSSSSMASDILSRAGGGASSKISR